ncbi:MAG: hypothetical protein HY519_02605 [Candidatus Aenigmarchaeota archaeon]|nr:hypothetical protein [Candidatus Aenigmarchaeota archaeon]
MNQYTELYAWILNSFGYREFDMDSFRATFPSGHPHKVIHDLVKHGYLVRTRHGAFHAIVPEQLVEGIVQKGFRARNIVAKAERKYAYTQSSAVPIWTDGYYWTGFTKGFRPMHIKVLVKDLAYWGRFFVSNNARYSLANESRTLFGFAYILHPENGFKAVERDGVWVEPLDETVQFCLEYEAAYEPALEYLDERFGIGYRRREALQT